MTPDFTIPEILPAMVLSDCNLLPHSILPLYLFEERYRKLAKDCLENDRLFFVAMRKDPSSTEISLDEIHPYSTVGLMQTCKENEDGTFHLVLQGLARIKIDELVKLEPYPVFKVTPHGEDPSSYSDPSLCNELIGLIKDNGDKLGYSFVSVATKLAELDEPSVTADILASHMIRHPVDQQHYLSLARPNDRLEMIRSFFTSWIKNYG